MPVFPPAFIAELRARLSLSQIIGRRVPLKRAGREWSACCPFHQEKSPSFTVNDAKGFFHCFGCGAHGDIVGFVMRYDSLSFPEAVERLAQEAGLPVPQATPEARAQYDEQQQFYAALEAATVFFMAQLATPMGQKAAQYLAGRGVSLETQQKFRLGYAPQDGSLLQKALGKQGFSDKILQQLGLLRQSERDQSLFSFFRNRLMFPVADPRGRVVAFGARLLEGEGPKYINSPEHPLFHKGRTLYNLNRARMAAADASPLIVAEGYLDVITLAEAGFAGAVAPLGTALTEEQIELLWQVQPPELARRLPLHLCFDGDTAGQRAAQRSLERVMPHLRPGHSVCFVMLSGGEDPDSLIRRRGAGAMQSAIEQAVPLLDLLWQQAMAAHAVNTPEGRSNLEAELRTRLTTIKDAATRNWYEQDLRQRLRGLTWQTTQKNNSKNLRAVPLANLTTPSPAALRRAEQWLAAALNHPHCVGDFAETLAALPMSLTEYAELRSALLELLADTPDVSCDDLQQQLRLLGHGGTIDKVLSPQLMALAPFARPQANPQAVQAGLLGLQQAGQRDAIQQEIIRLRNEPLSEQSLAQLQELQEQLASLQTPFD